MDLKAAFREQVRPSDLSAVREVVTATGFFSAPEIEIADELLRERLAKGDASGYFFLFAEFPGAMAGYTCYGPVPATLFSHDIYWIAVHPDFQRRGLGRELIERTESLIRRQGGRQVYMDTSARPQYAPTRRFYEAAGYTQAARLPDFYAPGDAKIIYVKTLAEGIRI